MGELANYRKGVVPIIIFAFAIIVIAVVINIAFGGKLLTVPNINSICISSVIACFCAWGYCFIFGLNYMDMSIGAVIMLTIYASGELGNRIGPAGVVIGGIGAGLILLMINFNLFVWTKIPTWVAGLGLCLIYEAIMGYYMLVMQAQGDSVVLLKKEYSMFGHAPGIYIVFAIGLVVAYIVYNRSTLGLNMRSIGSNPNIAKTMGINIPRTVLLTGLVCGFFIGCAGFMRESYSLRVFTMTGLMSLSVIFPPMASVFLAQVLSKWINIIIAIPFCTILIYICYSILSIMNVPSGTLQEALLGVFVIVFGVIAQRKTTGVVK